MKRLVVFIISVFILGCEKNKMNFYEADFYGNSVEIPEFLIYNEKEVETELKYYCKNNLYFKDSTETTIFNAIVCEYPRIENLDYDFEYLKDVFEESCEVRKIEILELEDISIKSTNKGNYFLFENIEQSSEQKYIKRIYIAFEDLFIYIYYKTDIKNTKVIKQLDELAKRFEKEKVIKNIVLPENTDVCNNCSRVLFG